MSKQALDGSRTPAFRLSPFDVVIIGLDTNDGPEHVHYDARVKLPVSESLVESIAQLGVLETIGVTKEDDGRVIVLWGRQRVRAARALATRMREAGKTAEAEAVTVPCLSPVKGWTDAELVSASVAENEIRQGDTVLVRAEKAGHLVRLWGAGPAGVKQAARAMGVKPAEVDALLRLRSADPAIHAAIEAGTLAPSAALRLAELPKPEQAGALAALSADGARPTIERARDHVRQSKAGDDDSKVPGLSRAQLKLLAGSVTTDKVLEGLMPIQIIALCLGELKPNKVKGLVALVRELSPKKGGAA